MRNSLNEFDVCSLNSQHILSASKNVNKSIVICCFGNTEISNSLGGELTWSNDELNNIFNTYRLWFVYLCVYAIGTIK